MTISVIIPTRNEAKNLPRLIPHLQDSSNGNHEIIVVDGNSQDDTLAVAKALGATVLSSPQCGRGAQMNYAATHAKGDILYFVHADTLPPKTWRRDIQQAIDAGFPVGCYRFRFESDRWLLRMNAYFTRFDRAWCRGGDQSLYVTREVFDEMKGFRADYIIMEDYDFLTRVRTKYPFKIIPDAVLVSARKYEENSYLQVQIANLIVFTLYRFGVSPNSLYKLYHQILRYRN